MSRRPKLLLLQVGCTFEPLARVRGDYDVWFREALGVSDEELEVARIHQGEGLPAHLDYRGILVSGSAAMVTDREPWSLATADYLLEALARAVPLLGVCYGHQLLADALGGRVDNNPNGRQVGTVDLTLNDHAREDPLFSVLPERALVHVSHCQSVLELPAQASVLGGSANDAHYAFRAGERAWGVQFHPEFDHEIAKHYVTLRREAILAEGGDPEARLATIRESEHGRLLLRRFADLTRE